MPVIEDILKISKENKESKLIFTNDQSNPPIQNWITSTSTDIILFNRIASLFLVSLFSLSCLSLKF